MAAAPPAKPAAQKTRSSAPKKKRLREVREEGRQEARREACRNGHREAGRKARREARTKAGRKEKPLTQSRGRKADAGCSTPTLSRFADATGRSSGSVPAGEGSTVGS